jgi:ribulose-5-phosphate 4-epimerase/fuculose-1-phosphate aldolase
VLSRLGLVTAYGHVSARAGESMVITPAADLATVTEPALVDVPLAVSALPAGAPAEAWAHLALYRRRPEAAAIARAQPPGAFAAAAAATSLVPLHGQAAWLGESIPVHNSAALLRSPELAEHAARCLPAGEALLLRGNGALTLGATPGIAVARMWLLSAACETFLAALAAAGTAGTARPLSAEEIASWRAVGGELLPRLWHHLRRTLGLSATEGARNDHPRKENGKQSCSGAAESAGATLPEHNHQRHPARCCAAGVRHRPFGKDL